MDFPVLLASSENIDPRDYTWFRRDSYRYAALEGTTTEPPVLQVAWQNGNGRIEWRRVETVVVSRADYDRK